MHPQVGKTTAIISFPHPNTKREVVGVADYYRWFVPGFAELTSALSDLS